MKNFLITGVIFDAAKDLSDEQAGKLFKAIGAFANDEPVQFDDAILKGIWILVLPIINKIKDTVENRTQANRQNGMKGGRPPKKKTESNFISTDGSEIRLNIKLDK